MGTLKLVLSHKPLSGSIPDTLRWHARDTKDSALQKVVDIVRLEDSFDDE